MRRSSGRGTTEPIAALVAVAAVCLGCSLYAGVLERPDSPDPGESVARTTLERASDAMAESGVIQPALLPLRVDEFDAPAGWEANVTVRFDGTAVHVGPTPPADASRASRRVSVRYGPGRIRPGRLVVVVWR